MLETVIYFSHLFILVLWLHFWWKFYYLLFSTAGDKFSAKFLIENGANVNVTTSADDRTALHMTAACELGSSDDDRTHMSHIAQCLLQHAANVNSQDTCGK